ncbi:MAG TPA: alpha/beta hydrolase [Pyrinomonadaceae bacterium]|nr:alpha/beta hydrolase [Pyrinomonadaceae bacterium]
MKKLLFLVSFIFLLQASRDCFAQTPREGYLPTSDGVRIFYKVVGSGAETLVAVHGGPGNSLTSILPDLEPLAKKRTVIYYDQRGNGRSSLTKDRAKLSISKHIADLEALRVHFKLDQMTLLGNSWGGLLVSYYAAAHPDKVQRMILHSPSPPMKGFLVELEQEIESRVGRLLNADQIKRYRVVSNRLDWAKSSDPRATCREFFQLLFPTYVSKPESAKLLKGDVCSGSEQAVRNQMVVNMQIWNSLGDFNLLPSLSVVKAPVLVIHGAADPIPVKASETWANGFPNARLLIIKGAGHIPQIEQPEIFFEAVETFLKGSFPANAKTVQVLQKRVER